MKAANSNLIKNLLELIRFEFSFVCIKEPQGALGAWGSMRQELGSQFVKVKFSGLRNPQNNALVTLSEIGFL